MEAKMFEKSEFYRLQWQMEEDTGIRQSRGCLLGQARTPEGCLHSYNSFRVCPQQKYRQQPILHSTQHITQAQVRTPEGCLHNYTIHFIDTMPWNNIVYTLYIEHTVRSIHTRFNWNSTFLLYFIWNPSPEWTTKDNSEPLISHTRAYIRKCIHWIFTWITCVIVSAFRLHWLMPCTGEWARKCWWKLG